jgi:hypothetical protein
MAIEARYYIMKNNEPNYWIIYRYFKQNLGISPTSAKPGLMNYARNCGRSIFKGFDSGAIRIALSPF